MTEPTARACWPQRFLQNEKRFPLRAIEVRYPTDLHHADVPIFVERSGPYGEGDLMHMVVVPEGVVAVANILMPKGYARLWYADGSHVFVPPREGRLWIWQRRLGMRREWQSSDVPLDVPVRDSYHLGKRVLQ